MATAKHVFVPAVITPSSTSIVLTLSQPEAKFLADVLSAIGGDPATTRRCHQSPISRALESAGVWPQGYGGDKTGSITFNEVK